MASTVAATIPGANFPRLVFDDPTRDPVDVALFDYCSGLRRRIGKRPPVPVVAKILTERLQDLSIDYDEIFIIAHSMGGLIAADALRNYVIQRDEESGLLRVLAGMIDISTPWNGSRSATARIRVLTNEWAVLQEDSAYQQNIRSYLRAKVDSFARQLRSATRERRPGGVLLRARDSDAGVDVCR